MIKNFLLLSARNIKRSRAYFVVSVGSLALGFAALFTIFTDVRQELSFDNFHSKGDRIVRINSHFNENGNSRVTSRTPFPAKPFLQQDFPEIENVARFAEVAQSRSLFNYNGIVNYENIHFADPGFLEIFDFTLLKGDRATALSNPNSVIMTESAARRYFPAGDALGKSVRFQRDTDLTVTGIMKDLPPHSHIQFEILLPVEFQRLRWRIAQNNFYDLEEDWLWNGAWTYILLREGTDREKFAAKIAEFPSDRYPDGKRDKVTYEIQDLAGIHFSQGIGGLPTPSGSLTQTTALSAIAVLIMVIAIINFINLTTARAPARTKEVGLRKTFGAYRYQIVVQFLCETLVVTFFSVIVGLLIADLTMPYYAATTGKHLSFDLLETKLLSLIGASLLVLTLGAGLYPAIFLSRPAPSKALKGIFNKEKNSTYSLRSGLVVFQLIVSTLLVSGIFVIREQLKFIESKDLGFDRSQIITIGNGQTFGAYAVFRERLLGTSGIDDVYRGYIPGQPGWSVSWTIEGKQEHETIPVHMIDENFVSMFGLRVVAGRDYIPGNKADTLSALVNEKMVRDMGWTNEDALGKKLSYIGGNDNKTLIELNIVGVVRNANLESLYKPIQAMVFRQSPWGDIAVKFTGDPVEKINQTEIVYKELAPEWPFEYSFLDEDISTLYSREQQLSKTIQLFSVLAIAISCGGLIALCSFVTRQRMKEIAIRKVLGATAKGIALLLGRYFTSLAVISFLIATPIGLYLSDEWLSSFAFAVKPGLGLFVKSALALALVIVAGIGYHIYNASQENPATTLKSE